MDSTRQNKISRLIQQDLGNILLHEMKPVLGQSLVTVTGVRVTPDLALARVHVSIFPIGGATKEGVMELLNHNLGDLRRRLGMLEAHQLRIIPQLQFFLDDSLDYMENIEKLLKQ
ncbi:MAG: 30S ribosome-binding factor RbfA [Bacteroidales bacterium]|nr:30S ribosome-binding factor RbfA [Bacteroidales bacterium]